MMLIDKNQVFLAGTGLQKDEVLFITSNTELIQVKKHLESKGIAYEVNNPIKAVKGNLTLRSGYRQRTDHLGLWQLKILSVP
jgi:hypothetical protein